MNRNAKKDPFPSDTALRLCDPPASKPKRRIICTLPPATHAMRKKLQPLSFNYARVTAEIHKPLMERYPFNQLATLPLDKMTSS